MSQVYAIADLHLGHAKLAELRGFASADAHDDELVRRWNSVVTKRDVVYVLGDVFCIDRLREMRGMKKLVLGNHDRKPVSHYFDLFTSVRAMFEWDNCLLTHIPVHPNQRGRYRLNVHGHMHTGRVQQWHDAVNGQDGYEAPDPWYRCVSAEQVDLTPRLLVEVTR